MLKLCTLNNTKAGLISEIQSDNIWCPETKQTRTSILSHPGPLQFPLPRGHIVVVFYVRASYWLPSLSFHDNRASHSRDAIWPWKFKVKGKGQKYPVSTASCWLISLVFHIRTSYRLPSLSFHDNRASHSWDIIWPWKFKVKCQCQSYSSQNSIQLTHFLFVSHQLDQPFLRYGKYNVRLQKTDLKFYAQIAKNILTEIPQNLIRWKAW